MVPVSDRGARSVPFSRRLLACSVPGWVLVVAGALPAVAQDTQSQPVELQPITVEGVGESYKPERASSPKYPQPLLDTPQTITVIPQEVIEDQGATSLRDVLRFTPGISLGAGEGGIPAGDRAFIRGFDARTDTFIDGARDFGGYSRDPFNLEQVEVIKGPGSAFTGRGSTGGSINLVTKTPFDEPFYGTALTFGTDMTKRVTADVNQPLTGLGLENAAVRINVMGHDSEVAGRDEVENQRWGVAPSVAFGLGMSTRLTLSYFHLSADNLPDYGHPFDPATGQPVAVDRDNFYGLTSRDFEETQTDIGTAEVEHDFSDSLTLRNQLRYGRTRRENVVTKPEYTAGASVVERAARSRDSVDEILINQTDLTTSFATGRIEHRLVTGVELSREWSENRSKSIDPASDADLFNPNPDEPYLGTITPAANAAESTTDSFALYAFDAMELSERWELLGGLRWDNFETDFTNAAGQEFSRSDSVVNWRAGVVYKPLPNGSVYAAAGTSVNPSAEGLTLSETTEQLEPEESVSYEIGTKWDVLDRRLALTAAVFRTEKTNARTSAGFGIPQVLQGEQRVDGFELGIAGNVTDKLSLFGGYTYLKSEIVESANAAEVGNEFANVAPHNFSLWATYQILEDWDVGVGALYQDRRYANNANTSELPSYWRFDAMVSYQLAENVALQLNLLNLTDEVYYDATHVGQFAYVAPGRTALLTTSFRF